LGYESSQSREMKTRSTRSNVGCDLSLLHVNSRPCKCTSLSSRSHKRRLNRPIIRMCILSLFLSSTRKIKLKSPFNTQTRGPQLLCGYHVTPIGRPLSPHDLLGHTPRVVIHQEEEASSVTFIIKEYLRRLVIMSTDHTSVSHATGILGPLL
jgi:hypothetical protein